MMKRILICLFPVFTNGCFGMFSENPEISVERANQLSRNASVIAAEDLVAAADTTRYVELVSQEEKIQAMPQVRCNQSGLIQANNNWNLTMTCQLMVGNQPMAVDSGDFEVNWVYQHPLPDAIPEITDADGSSPIARLSFSNADLMRVLFQGDTGRYSAKLIREGREFEIKTERPVITGEACDQPVAGLINFREGNGFGRALTAGLIINEQPPSSGGSFLIGDMAQITNISPRFVVIGNGRVNHLGSNARVIVANFGSFTSANPVRDLYAGPYSVVNAGAAQTMRFRTDLAFCDDQL